MKSLGVHSVRISDEGRASVRFRCVEGDVETFRDVRWSWDDNTWGFDPWPIEFRWLSQRGREAFALQVFELFEGLNRWFEGPGGRLVKGQERLFVPPSRRTQ